MSLGLSDLQASGSTDSPFHPSPTDETQPSPTQAGRAAPSASRLSSLPSLLARPPAPFQELHAFQTAHTGQNPQTSLAPLSPLTSQAPLAPHAAPQAAPESPWNGWNPYVWQNSPLKQSCSAPCTSTSSPVPDSQRRSSASLPQLTSDTATAEAEAFLAAFTGGGFRNEEDRGTEASISAENLELGTWPRHLTG